MKYIIELLIIITASCFCPVKLKEIELNAFLKLLQCDYNVVSRKIFFDNELTSINDYLKISNVKLLNIDHSWPITKNNVNEVSSLLNKVISCEYCDIMYYFNELSFLRFEICLKSYSNIISDFKKCYQNNQKTLLKPMLMYISSMILTLVGLNNHISNPESNNKDILIILVSWYAFINTDILSDPLEETLIERFDSIRLVNIQIKSYLERFSVPNCPRPLGSENFDLFKLNISKRLTKSIADAEEKNLTTEPLHDDVLLDDFKKPIIYTFQHLCKIDLFVLCPSDVYQNKLLKFIETTSEFSVIKNKYCGDKPDELDSTKHYRAVVKKSKDIKTMLNHEMEVLQIILKKLISFIVHELKDIVNNWDITQQKVECNTRILRVLEIYIRKFKGDSQPLYLIYNMILINKKIWLICNKMTQDGDGKNTVVNDINNLERSGLENFTGTSDTICETFLKSLSESMICSKLHPVISNLFWDKMIYHDTSVFEYLIDYKHLSTHYVLRNRENKVCNDISKIILLLIELKDKINFCSKFTKVIGVGSLKLCVNQTIEICTDIRDSFKRIIKNFFTYESIEWLKMFLTVTYNLNNVDSFYVGHTCINSLRARNIMHFQHDIMNLLNIQYHIKCSYDEKPKKCCPAMKLMKSTNKKISGKIYKKNNSVAKISKMADIDRYEKYFRSFFEYVGKIVVNDDLDEDFTLYWDGNETTIYDVYISIKNRKFGLQDGFDFQFFTVKWILAVAYTKLLDILDDVIYFKYKPVESDIELLNNCQNSYFKKLPLVISKAPEYDFNMFLTVVENFDGINTDELIKCRTRLRDELVFVGVVPDSKPHMKESISERIVSLSAKLSLLYTIYREIEPKDTIIEMGLDMKTVWFNNIIMVE